MTHTQVSENQWVDLRDNRPDYAALLRSGATFAEAHINPPAEPGDYNGTCIHVYRDKGPLSAAEYVRTVEAPELEGLPLEGRRVPQAVWDRLQQECDKE